MESSTELEKMEPTSLVKRGAFTLAPQNLGEAMEFARIIASSELCPKEFRGKPQDTLIAVMMGAELGITPMQSLQNIAVINGRPTMWGDLLLALVQASGLLEAIQERDPQDCWAEREGRCEIHRKEVESPVVRTYSYDMAEQAGLIKRSGDSMPWRTNPGRMLQMRARSWAIRDAFADVLKGLQTREEVEDYPTERPTIQMPRRASEINKGQVDRFLSTGSTTDQTPAATQKSPQRQTDKSAKDGAPWKGKILRVKEVAGETGGRPWTRYILETSDNDTFFTFDDKIGAFAKEAVGSPVVILWEPGKKGGRSVLSVEPDTE